jgi:hypothetical protein
MGAKTRIKVQDEEVIKYMIRYWKLQNNNEYLQFYHELNGGTNDPLRKMFDEMMVGNDDLLFKEKETEDEYKHRIINAMKEKGSYEKFILYRDKLDKFGLVWTVADPSKKIDWTNPRTMLKSVTDDILDTMEEWRTERLDRPIKVYSSLRSMLTPLVKCFNEIPYSQLIEAAVESHSENYPIITIEVDLRFEKKEIMELISEAIDVERETHKIEPYRSGSHVEKLPLYAQVWDLRKGPTGKTLLEIAKMLKANVSTIKSRFYKAFELIYDRKYDREIFNKEIRSKVHIEALERTCKDCPKREKDCRELCPDVIAYYMQDPGENKLRERLFSDLPKKRKVKLGLEEYIDDSDQMD